MGVRLSLARLERAAERRFGRSDEPCRCGVPPVVRVFDRAAGIAPAEREPCRCERCGRRRLVISVHIVQTPIPEWDGLRAADRAERRRRDEADADAF